VSSTLSVRQLRLSSHIAEAMQLASEALGKTPGDFELMGETIRVLILAQQAEAASSLYQVFSSASDDNNLEPEVLVRLALQLGRADLIENMPPPAGPSWLVKLLTDGEDPMGNLNPETVEIKVVNGPAVFNFQGACPHCKHSLGAQVSVSLLIHRVWNCPSCFGSVQLDHKGARDCLEMAFPEAEQNSNEESDAVVMNYLRPKLMGAEPLPDIVMALGQEYHFLINELALSRPSDGTSEGPSAS